MVLKSLFRSVRKLAVDSLVRFYKFSTALTADTSCRKHILDVYICHSVEFDVQSINQSCISGLFHFILLPDHSWQIIEISQGQT